MSGTRGAEAAFWLARSAMAERAAADLIGFPNSSLSG